MALESFPSSSRAFSATKSSKIHQRIRKDDPSWSADTFAPHQDGHQWRKYGEKKVLNSMYPRFYYRCSYKFDMNCPATKQIQQKNSNDPPLYVVTYFNHHSCNTSCDSTCCKPFYTNAKNTLPSSSATVGTSLTESREERKTKTNSSLQKRTALESAPSSSSAFGATGTRRTHQRLRKDEPTWTVDTFAPYQDGNQWRKYGEKKVLNSKFQRYYYRCSYKFDLKCPATKHVQQKDSSDPPLYVVTYFNKHTCNTSSKFIGAPDDLDMLSSGKAISICFSSYGSKEQDTLPSSSAMVAPNGVQALETNQQLVPSSLEISNSLTENMEGETYTDVLPPKKTSPNSTPIIDLEVDEPSETECSDPVSRILLPIGQSRCIEYFQFL